MALFPLVRNLDTNGDGTGTKNANINGAITPVTFFIQPPATQDFEFNRLLILVRDTAISANSYGNISTLANGVEVRFVSDLLPVPISLTDNLPIQSNTDWGRLVDNAEPRDYGGGPEALIAKWNTSATFIQSGVRQLGGFTLNGYTNDKLEVIINDDLTGLLDHFFTVQGVADTGGISFRNSQ